MNKTPLLVCVLPPVLMLGFAGFATAAPGDPDSSFGTGGMAVHSLSAGEDIAHALAVQSDGKIIVAGEASGGDFALLRLNSNGTLDGTFGSGTGKVLHSFGLFEAAVGVAALADGKIVVGGAGLVGANLRDFAVARCLPGGGLDPSFNSGVVVNTDISLQYNDHVYAMALQPDGKILLAGSHRSYVAMVRYLANGTLDSGFGTGGKVFTSADSTTVQQINALAVMSDGRIVAAGQSRTGNNTDVLVARYLSNGMPDTNFGSGGKTVVPLVAGSGSVSDIANAVAVQTDGKVVVVGSSGGDFLLMRFTTGGLPDSTFGGGAGGIPLGFQNGTENGTGVLVQPDGLIIVSGSTTIGGRDYFAAMRIISAGTAVDPSFGSGGGFAVGLTTGTDTPHTAIFQTDGKLLMAGAAGGASTRDFGIARFETAPPLTLPSWRQQHFGSTANSGDAANDADPDKDGLVNLLEYAFGQNPTQVASRTVPLAQITGGNLLSTFTAPSLTGITYAAEWSTTMGAGTWQSLTDSGSGSVHTFSVPVAGKTKVYLRWKITVP